MVRFTEFKLAAVKANDSTERKRIKQEARGVEIKL